MRFIFVLLLSLLNLLALADPKPGLKFIENKNQWPSSFDFVANVPGGKMILQPSKFLYYFLDGKKIEDLHHHSHDVSINQANEWQQDQFINGHAVEVSFVGGNTHAKPLMSGKSTEYYNYFIGSDSTRWASKAYAYDAVTYSNLYDGITLKVYSVGQNGKYDLIVSPEADPAQISIQYSGADKLLLENGNLFIKTPFSEIVEKRPFAYQIIDGQKREVKCEFVLNNCTLAFFFPEGYDGCYELVIDPLLIFSTYSGSTADNWGSTATPGERGNLYSAGVTNQQLGGTFPASAGAFQRTYGGLYDIGILKYDSAGKQLLYATYLGGEDSESPHSLVMNAEEELIVFGTTSSGSFPTTMNAYDRSFNGGSLVNHVVTYNDGSDMFISRISKDGSSLNASTYLGGTSNDGLNAIDLNLNYGDQLRGDVIADVNGNIYISSVTRSPDFPAVNSSSTVYKGGNADAVLIKLSPDLSQIIWSMFIGGSGTDASHTLKLAKDNSIYIAGGTTSSDFPVTPGSIYQSNRAGDADGWIAKISAGGNAILHATYTGTVNKDQVYFLDINEDEEVYVYGQTNGRFPIYPSPAAVYNVPNSGQFVQKFNTNLSSLIFSTVFGTGKGSPDISPTAFIVNECNNLYMAGWGGELNAAFGWNTNTRGLETTPDALQRTTTGNDFYFIVLTDDGAERLYATFLGGTQSRTHVDGGTSRFDKEGIVYHAVCSGCISSAGGNSTSDFPTTVGAWSRVNRSQNCNNAAFKFDLSSLKARIRTNSVRFDDVGINKICLPDKIVFQNFSTGGRIYKWDLGDGTNLTTSDTTGIVHQYKSIGRYQVWLTAIDEGTCKVTDVAFTFVDVYNSELQIQDDDDLCEGTTYQIKASGGAQYAWRSDDGLFQSNIASPSVSPEDTTIYYLTVREESGCIVKDTVQLNVIPIIKPAFEIKREADCSSTPSVMIENLTDSLKQGDKMFFDFGDGTTEDFDVGVHKFEDDGLFNIKLVGVREFCVTEKEVSMPFFKLKIPNVITPGIKDGSNDVFTIQFGEEQGSTPSDFGYNVSLIIYNRWGEKVYESNDYRYDWAGNDVGPGIYYYETTVEGHTSCKSWIHLIKDK